MKPEGDFVFFPDPGYVGGTLYNLGPRSLSYVRDSLVVIPYSEPRRSKPLPVFYPVTRRQTVTDFLDSAESPALSLKAEISGPDYRKMVLALKEHIQLGNIYEINLCMRFSAVTAANPFGIFLRLCEISQAPYLMLAKIGKHYIMCASPEMFLKKEGSRLSTKPIKGTIRRSPDSSKDDALKDELQNSLKDRTENVMAVDVARNDLSMLAQRGTVKVNKLYNIESFRTVHQMVSTVSCELRKNVSFEDIIAATFPMASMTGAPKERAMQLIGEYESFERSYYSGTMGIIESNGDFTLPVLIRSLFYEEDKKLLWSAVGGAITYLSDPEAEYAECLLKAQTMLKALNGQLSL